MWTWSDLWPPAAVRSCWSVRLNNVPASLQEDMWPAVCINSVYQDGFHGSSVSSSVLWTADLMMRPSWSNTLRLIRSMEREDIRHPPCPLITALIWERTVSRTRTSSGLSEDTSSLWPAGPDTQGHHDTVNDADTIWDDKKLMRKNETTWDMWHSSRV